MAKEIGNIKGLWLAGIMDGHGANGHLVSDYIKKTFPKVLSNLIMGGNGVDPLLNITNSNNNKKKNKKIKNFLP